MDTDAERLSKLIDATDAKLRAQAAKQAQPGRMAAQSPVALPSAPPMPKRIPAKHAAGWYIAASPSLKVAIPDTENRSVRLSDNNKRSSGHFVVSLPKTDKAVDAKAAADGTVVYLAYQQATDVAVQSFEDSARI